MSKSFAAALGIAVAAQVSSCAPEPADALDSVRDGATTSIEHAADSGARTPTGGTRDVVPLDASRADRDAKADAGTMVRAGDLDAGAREPSRDASDASKPGTAADSSVPTTSKPSAGCSKARRPEGGRISVPGDHNFVFPSAYDGKEPLPLLIGFHAAGNPIEQIETLTQGSDFEKNYVRAFPKSKGSAWDYAADIGKVLAMYDELVANHCVDLTRVFATGHSSGAQLIVQILTPAHKADADHLGFKAVAPVAASRYGGVSRAIPTLYIQGAHDNVRNSDGSDVVKEFTTANGCAPESTSYTAVSACTSSGKSVKSGCVEYQGCEARTVWCSHDDPQYSNTNHGWPCFATRAMYDFFAVVPEGDSTTRTR